MLISYWSQWFCFYWYLIFTEWCFWFWKRFKWSTSLLPRFLPTNEKISFFREIPHSPTGRGDFLPTPLIISTRFLVWPWTVSQFSTPKNEFFLNVFLVIGNVFLIHTWKYWIWISKNESTLKTTTWKSVDYSSYLKLLVGVSLG